MPFKLKKLSITDEEAEVLMGLVSDEMSVSIIAVKMKTSRWRVWRNMVFLGVNKTRSQPQKKRSNRTKYFDVDKFSNHYKY